MEYIKGTDLYEYVENQNHISEEEASFIMGELLLTMKYIHDSGIVHRDLKAENIMVI